MTYRNRLLAGVAAVGLLAATPAFADEDTSTGMAYGSFDEIDVNQDGYVDETEWSDSTGMDTTGWAAFDADADNRLDADEWGAFEENQTMDQGAGVSNQADTEAGGDADAGGEGDTQ